MAKKVTTRSSTTKTSDQILDLVSTVDKLSKTVGDIANTVQSNIGTQAIQVAAQEAISEEVKNTTMVDNDPVIDAINAGEAQIVKAIADSGQPMLLSRTDRRGYTTTVNLSGVALDMFDRIRKNRTQKNRV